ncbi:VOC family protein [Agrococcus citreus]|uniref:VOC family protein n=1 Tax=Agrococcus citreus TaxID=84643 RepID=A0ABN1YUS9_9MICO
MSLVVHFEIHASEPQRLIDFYSQLLGWRFERFGEWQYWSISTGEAPIGAEGPGAGIDGGLAQREGPAPEAGAPINGSTIVVSVDDVDATFARGIELGAAEAVAPEDLQGVGRVGYVRDPDGNVFGMISEVLSDGTDVRAVAVDPMQVTPEP